MSEREPTGSLEEAWGRLLDLEDDVSEIQYGDRGRPLISVDRRLAGMLLGISGVLLDLMTRLPPDQQFEFGEKLSGDVQRGLSELEDLDPRDRSKIDFAEGHIGWLAMIAFFFRKEAKDTTVAYLPENVTPQQIRRWLNPDNPAAE